MYRLRTDSAAAAEGLVLRGIVETNWQEQEPGEQGVRFGRRVWDLLKYGERKKSKSNWVRAQV